MSNVELGKLTGIQSFDIDTELSTASAVRAITAHQRLMQLLPLISADDDQSDLPRPMRVVLIGDQSAAKTTLANRLTAQAALLVDKRIGTKVPTEISKVYRPELPEVRCSLYYENHKYTGMSMDELSQRYEELFRDAALMPDKVCRVEIATPNPDPGVFAVDVPGMTGSVDGVGDRLLDCQRRYVKDNIIEGTGGVGILCHNASTDPTTCFWSRLVQNCLDRVPKGHLYVAMTRMDELNVPTVAGNLREDTEFRQQRHLKTVGANGMGLLQASPLDILHFMARYLRKHTGLPTHARFFFVASYKGSREKLKKFSTLEERNRCFREDVVDGEATTTEHMIFRLINGEDWLRNHIKLRDMTPEEEKEFRGMVTTEALFREVLSAQYENMLELALGMEKVVKAEADKCSQDKKEIESFLQSHGGLRKSTSTVDFLNDAVRYFFVLGSQEPVGSDTNKEQQLIKDRYVARRAKFGCTLERERELHKCIANQCSFPPADVAVRNLDADMHALPEFKTAGISCAAYSLDTTSKRTLRDYFWRAIAGIEENSPDMKHIKKSAHAGNGGVGLDSNAVLANEIKREHTRRHQSGERGCDAGNSWLASRFALNVWLQMQVAVDIICAVQRYSFVLEHGHSGPREEACDIIGPQAKILQDLKERRSSITVGSVSNEDHMRREGVREVLSGLVKEADPKHVEKTPERIMPRHDCLRVLFEMFFAKKQERVCQWMDRMTGCVGQTLTPSVNHIMDHAPLLVYRDVAFTQAWAEMHRSPLWRTLSGGEHVPEAYNTSILEAAGLNPRARCELLDMIHDTLVSPFQPLSRQSMYAKGNAEDMVDRSYEFLFKRNLSVGSVLQIIASNWVVDKEREEVKQTEKLDLYQEEIVERLLSLYLGYPLPYSEAERPSHLRHLSPDAVITTLGAFRLDLKAAAKDAVAGEPVKGRPGEMSWLEKKAFSSPIAHAIWFMAVQDNGQKFDEAFEQLDALVAEMRDSSMKLDFNRRLIRLVGDRRYAHVDSTEKIRLAADELESRCNELRGARCWLSGYISFLKKHGAALGGCLWQDGEDMRIISITRGYQAAMSRRAVPKSSVRLAGGAGLAGAVLVASAGAPTA